MVPLGIDREKIMLQLGQLEEHLARLKDIGDRIKAVKEDVALLPAAERLLQITIEDSLNIGSHIIAGSGLTRADTYREVFTRLKEAGILSEELGNALEGFASFRNRLVHLYMEVNEEEVISKLSELAYFKEFAKQVVEYLKTKEDKK